MNQKEEHVSYFELDEGHFVFFTEYNILTTTNNTNNNNNTINNHLIKLTISDGEHIYFNYQSIQFINNNPSINSNNNITHEFHLFEMIYHSLQFQDNNKFKYKIKYENDKINLIISMIVNPNGDYIILNIYLNKSINNNNTKLGHLSLFKYLITNKENDFKKIKKLNKISKNYEEAILQSKKVIEERDLTLKETYGSFLLILNSKKEMIKNFHLKNIELQSKIKSLENELNNLKNLQKSPSNKISNKSIMSSNSIFGNASTVHKGSGNSTLNNIYQTPKVLRNSKCVDAEDLLQDLNFE
ncbi:hypothetical protein ABK040_008308 [Willaertia magna]